MRACVCMDAGCVQEKCSSHLLRVKKVLFEVRNSGPEKTLTNAGVSLSFPNFRVGILRDQS